MTPPRVKHHVVLPEGDRGEVVVQHCAREENNAVPRGVHCSIPGRGIGDTPTGYLGLVSGT